MVENFSELLESSLSGFKYKEGEIIKGTVHAAENIFPNQIPEISDSVIKDIKDFSYSLK